MNENRYLQELEDRRKRLLNGKINSIPLKFKRFRKWLPGVEKRRYVIITASQKVGKSKFSDDIYLYDPFFYALENPDKVRYKVIYFSLEMGKQEKMNEFFCHLLFKLDGLRLGPTDLQSTDNEKPVPKYILDLLKSDKYMYYIEAFEASVVFIEDIRNPTGINRYCKQFMEARGKYTYKEGMVKKSFGEGFEPGQVVDFYESDDPEEYVTVIIDNYSNLTLESNMQPRENIERMSKYAITLRDNLNLNIVAVQHQAQAQEGVENVKMGKLRPSAAGLADCKTTIRDCSLALGLFNPFKHEMREYMGYDITKFKNRIRFLEIMESRNGGGGGEICPLFFDGATSAFEELPLPTDLPALEAIYRYMEVMDNPLPLELPEYIKIVNKEKTVCVDEDK